VPVLLLPAVSSVESQAARRHAQLARVRSIVPHARMREYVDADHDLHAQHPARVAHDLLELAAEV
jgi:hypothetical protein